MAMPVQQKEFKQQSMFSVFFNLKIKTPQQAKSLRIRRKSLAMACDVTIFIVHIIIS